MVLRINTNIASMRSARLLGDSDRKLAESLTRLSTGFKINRASDDPSGLVFAEQMRGQIVSVNQAISNAELATTMVETAESSLTEVNNLLIQARQFALQASNQDANDPDRLAILQKEIDDAMEGIALISKSTRFGGNNLLDGSTGVTGEATGDGLFFISANKHTRSSRVEGYEVEVTQVPTRSTMIGETALDEDSLPGLEVTLIEGGRTAKVKALPTDSARSFYGRLLDEIDKVGLNLDVRLNSDDILEVTHQEYGSGRTFLGASSNPGVLSSKSTGATILGWLTGSISTDEGRLVPADPGQDIAGTINEEPAMGRGQVLRGLPGNPNTDGLVVRYGGPLEELDTDVVTQETVFGRVPEDGVVGLVNVSNKAMDFQVGSSPEDKVTIALPRVAPHHLGRSVATASDYRSLADIRVGTLNQAKDALRVIDGALDEVTLMRGELGAVVRNSLTTNIASLRVTAENLMAAESTVRDADLAMELARVTRNKVLLESGAAAAAHANQVPRTVIRLLQ